MTQPREGQTLGGRWVIDALIGEGAMGQVYRAHHRVLNKPVAVKVLRAELANHPAIAARFLREARAASTIDSPHVVEVVDFGSVGTTHYLVMEFLSGKSLEAVLESGPMPLPMVYDLAIVLAEGFAAAHDAGVVHRDIKPENVMLLPHGDGTFACKIVDFGIAKLRDDVCEARLTAPGAMLGTPYYMSPEHCLGRDVDRRSDIYSLGAMLYELIVGRPPFGAETLSGIIEGHLRRAPTPLRELAPEISPLLADVVERCLCKRPEDRFASMHDVRTALEHARQKACEAAGETTSRSIRPLAPLPAKTPRVSPLKHVAVAAVVLLMAVVWSLSLSAPTAATRQVSVVERSLTVGVAAIPEAVRPVETAPRVAVAEPAVAEPVAAPIAVVPKRVATDVVDPWE